MPLGDGLQDLIVSETWQLRIGTYVPACKGSQHYPPLKHTAPLTRIIKGSRAALQLPLVLGSQGYSHVEYLDYHYTYRLAP